ncbi:MAG: O-antigen ligase family protein [Clostridia bacterium]|nr:O-antigen ligase family protein [Clostridia bacterium]
MNRMDRAMDKLLSRPIFSLFFVFLAVRANDLKKADEAVAKAAGGQGFYGLRILLWALCALVAFIYLWRLIRGGLRQKSPALWCLLALHGVLIAMTLIYRGATGYWLNWAAGLALCLLLDMGLQRERAATLEAFSLALLTWLLANLPVRILIPWGLNGPDSNPLFVPEWVIGNRVIYYRLAFPALAFEMIRAQREEGRYTLRTLLVFAVVTLTVALQRGGTALLGYALLLGMLAFFGRRALPRYALPITMLGVSVLLFLGLHFFRIQELFAVLIQRILHKDMTLTYRSDVWIEAVDVIRRYPITGVGYLPLSYMRELFHSTPETPLNHTHNQVLELLFHGGLLALLPFIGMTAWGSREALRHRRSPAVKTAAILLMVFLFMGTVDIFHTDPLYYALFILLGRADCLAGEDDALPRISFFARVRRDVKKRKKA